MMPPAGFTPVPLSDTADDPPAALCAIVILALRVPLASGSKLTYAVHELPGLSVVPVQPSAEISKSPGFVPPSVSDETTNEAPLPVFLIFTTRPEVARPSVTDPNPIDVGVTSIQGVGVPFRVTQVGLACPLCEIITDPLTPLPVVGAYEIEMVQELPGMRGALRQLLVCV